MNTMQLDVTRTTIFRTVDKTIPPCSFTNEEKLARIEQSVRDANLGLGITQDAMFSRHPEWL
jgi:hypothetical protein